MKRHVSHLIGLLSIAMLLSMADAAAAFADTRGWSRPQEISPDGQSSWFPDLAVDVTGRVHLVWSAGKAGYDQVYYTASDDGVAWGPINDIAARPQTAGSEVTRPSVLIGEDGLFHLSYRDTRVYYAHAPVQQAFSVAQWSSADQVSQADAGYFSRLAQDEGGRLHLVLTENVPTEDCPICFHVFYRWSDDNGDTWSRPQDIAPLPTGSAKPQLLVDADQNIHVVWESGRGGTYGQLEGQTEVMYAGSWNRGATWGEPVKLAPRNGSMSKNIALASDPQGNLVVAWLRTPADRIYFQVSKDAGHSWSRPEVIGALWGGWSIYQSRLDDYSMATDSSGYVHLVVVGRPTPDETGLSLIQVEWDGRTWSEPEVIASYEGDAPEWPRVAIGLGNQVHVVWFVREEEHIWQSDLGQYKVWYTRGLADAPALPPAALPTLASPVPTHSAAISLPTVSPAPTPTALWSNTPITTGMGNAIKSEADELTVVALSLAPAVLLLAAIVVVARLQRR